MLMVIAGTLLVLFAVAWLGLQVTPAPFAPHLAAAGELKTIPLQANLPAPVERYYRTTIGDHVPVVESAVLSARGSMRIFGLRLPLRMRMIHKAGQEFRRYIEATWFGLPFVKIDEWYLGGRSHAFFPTGAIENDPKMNSATNLAMWAECLSLPSVFITDPRVRWEPIDETHARLVVPSPEGSDSFTLSFDARTGLMTEMEALRWSMPSDPARRLWQTTAGSWSRVNGLLLPAGAAAWDHGKPWLLFTVEDVAYNVDVTDYLRATGP